MGHDETAGYGPWEGRGTPLLTPTPSDVPALASLPTREWVQEQDTKHAASSVSEEADLDIWSFIQATASSLGKLHFFKKFIHSKLCLGPNFTVIFLFPVFLCSIS